MKLPERERLIAGQLLKEITARLQFLLDMGLDYLTLDRATASLSSGEAQRIHLATQIGSGLTGVLYILDEPSIGLHPHDNVRLIQTLTRLRDQGNTVLVVEHDEDTMRASDYIVEMDPGAGEHGGQVVAQGTPQEIMANSHSLTGAYLARRRSIPLPEQRREGNGQSLVIKGAREHNLKNVTVDIPPVASSTLTCGDQALIRQANHPLSIGEWDCRIGELLPELGLILGARCCHDHAYRRRDLS